MSEQLRIHASGCHALRVKGCRCVFDESDVKGEFHAETGCRLDAGVSDKTDENDLLYAVWLELHLKVCAGKTVLRPVLLNDDVPRFWSKLRMPLATPCIDGKRHPGLRLDLDWVDIHPLFEIITSRAMMWTDETLYARSAYRRTQLSH